MAAKNEKNKADLGPQYFSSESESDQEETDDRKVSFLVIFF